MAGPVMRCAVAVLAVLALVAAACGSGDDEALPAVEAAAEAPAGVDGELQAPVGTDTEAKAPVGTDAEAELPANAEASDSSAVAGEGLDGSAGLLSGGAWVVLEGLPGEVSVSASGSEIAVSWPAAAAVEGSPVAGYEVQWRSGEQDWTAARRVVVVGLSFVVGGLEDGTVYTVRVRPAAVQTAAVEGASITAGAGSDPTAEIVVDAPALGSEVYESVSALSGAVSFEMAGEPVWPATIEIPVDVERIGEDAEVSLVHFNEILDAWVPAPWSVFDRGRGVVVAEVYHLSLWLVVLVGGVVLTSSAAEQFVDEWWDNSTGWLRAGWSSGREFLLRDIPKLAGALLDKLDEAGVGVADWVQRGLQAARGLTEAALGFLASLFAHVFSLDIEQPVCSGPWPDWVLSIETEGRANNALYWCGEDNGFDQLRLKLTVNRGYSMVLEDEINHPVFGLFGTPLSPRNITVIESEVPGKLSDLFVMQLYEYADPQHIVFLPSGGTTTLLVSPGAFRDRDWITLGYYAEQIASLMDILFSLLAALIGDTKTLAAEGPTIIDCAWLLLSANRNASWFDKIIIVTDGCIIPAIPHLTKRAVINGVATAFSGFVLLVDYGRMLLDGTINSGNRVLIDRDPTITTTTTAPPTTTTTAPPTTTTTAPPTTAGVELNPAMEGGGIISVGGHHSCGLRSDGTIECWGSNTYADRSYTGQSDAPPGRFAAVSAGWYHSCALRTDDTVECWGANESGESDAPSGRFISVSAGFGTSCGIRTDQTITCWGLDTDGQMSAPSGQFAAVSAAHTNICGLRTDGTIECWGYNQLGESDAPPGRFAAVTTISFYSCGLRTDGTIECWGDNREGQLNAPSGRFTAVSAGAGHSCGLRTDGTIECWGAQGGQSDAPSGRFATVSSGALRSCGLRTGGTIECWGHHPDSEGNYTPQSNAPTGRFGPS